MKSRKPGYNSPVMGGDQGKNRGDVKGHTGIAKGACDFFSSGSSYRSLGGMFKVVKMGDEKKKGMSSGDRGGGGEKLTVQRIL